MIQYNYCPNCGTKITSSKEPLRCDNCGNIYYRNAKPCASVLIVKDEKVLLGIRKNDPYKGAYDIIGGFMEADELPENAAIRETKEETGLDVVITQFLGAFIDKYGDDGDHTLNLHYIGKIVGGTERARDDVAELVWVPIQDAPTDSGFQNTRDGIRVLKDMYVKGELS